MTIVHQINELIGWTVALGVFAVSLYFVFIVGSAHFDTKYAARTGTKLPPKPAWRNEMYKDGDAEPGDKSPYDGSEFLIL